MFEYEYIYHYANMLFPAFLKAAFLLFGLNCLYLSPAAGTTAEL